MVAAMAVTIASAAFAAFPAAADTAGGPNNVVLATATADGSSLTNSGVQVAPAFSPTVNSSNIAEASSRDCTGCHAAAAALQVIFVTPHATTFTPTDLAAATNSYCTSCFSFAYAYQYVVDVAGPVYLSDAAQQRIAQIRQEVAATVASAVPNDLTGADQLRQQLDNLAAQFKSVIDENLQQAGIGAQGTVDEHVDAAPAAG